MLDSGIKIIDRIIELLTYRKQSGRKLFLDHIEPIYVAMEKIHLDYLSALEQFIKDIPKIKNIDDLIASIKARKIPLEPLRVKINSFSKVAQKQKHLPDKVEHFFYCCTNYLDFKSTNSELIYYYGCHSLILEEVIKLKNADNSAEPSKFEIGLIHTQVPLWQKDIRHAWEWLTKAYSECRLVLLK